MIKNKNKPKIFIEEKEFNVQDFYISELGYLMMRLYSEENKTYTTYNLGTHDPAKNIFNEAIEKQRS